MPQELDANAGARPRARRFLLAALVPLIAAVALVASAASASAATSPSVTSPLSSTTVGTNIPIAFTLPTAPVSNSVVITISGGGLPTTITLSGAPTTVNFTLHTGNIVPGGPIAAVFGPSSLADGTYSFAISYQAASDSTFGSQTSTGVTVQNETLTPTLLAPTGSTSNPVSVQYTLPETPLPGSVTLTFAGSVTRVLTLSDSASGTGISFTFDPAHPTLAAKVTSILPASSIPDGSYTVTLGYQDALGNPVAVSSSTSVTIDTVTQAPLLTSPAAGAALTGSIPIGFSLPEAASTVQVLLAGANNYTLTLADTTSGTHSATVDPADPTASSDVTAFSGGNGSTIAPGTYTVTLRYEDVLQNPFVGASSANVIVSACAAGHYSLTGASPCTPADPGSYVPTPGATGESSCAAGSYQPLFGGSSCFPSPAGTYSAAGATLAIPCPTGAYCPASSGAPIPCAAGTYNNVIQGASSAACLPAPAGTYSGANAALPTACPAGTYNPDTSATTVASCREDQPGTWSAAQAAAPTPCDAGSYQPAALSSSCRLADAGFYVGARGASAEVPCAAGSFAAVAGARACVLAPIGTYAPAGSIAALPCPSGTSTTAPGSAGCQPVTLGGSGGSGGSATTPTVAVQSVVRLTGGRLRLVLTATTAGLFNVSARVPGVKRPYGSARTTSPASSTTIVVRAHGRAARRLSRRRRFTITVTFTPSGGGAAVTQTVTVKPSRAGKRTR